MPISTLSTFQCGDTSIRYQLDDETQQVGLLLFPKAKVRELARRREWLDDEPEVRKLPPRWRKLAAWKIDSLVQLHCSGDSGPIGFGQGRTMRNGGSTQALKFKNQKVKQVGARTVVMTALRGANRCHVTHFLSWEKGDRALRVWCVFSNRSPQPVMLEMLSSFSLGGMTPFASDDAPGRLQVHRLRSGWSAEAKLETRTAEELLLERSWQGHSVRVERFGQVGTMPARGFLPFGVVEDTVAGVLWGAQIDWSGSWQMEFYRQGDCVTFSGGLADYEFGHWRKSIAPGADFTTPRAHIATVAGDLDDLCQRLTALQEAAADAHPAVEADLPLIANEFCTSWGDPTPESLDRLAARLEGSPVKYLVIDAGWYLEPGGSWSGAHGDWIPGSRRFPNGLAEIARKIRERGLMPGLWFEAETVGFAAESYQRTEHQAKLDGKLITVGERRFWDLRDPWVIEFLRDRMIKLLRDCDFGYVKIDYNETFGIGCDGAESPGEGLRQHVEAVHRFFEMIRAELPDVVVENCASGGHRLTPSMMARTAMSSFSDAHETVELPILAANLHRVLLPRQSQIWAVLHPEDNERRLIYSLGAGFLGRLCLSGPLDQLAEWQWSIALRALKLYRRATPIIKHGCSRLLGEPIASYRHPRGLQALLRTARDGKSALVVAHSFADVSKVSCKVQLPPGRWKIVEEFATGEASRIVEGRVHWTAKEEFAGRVILLST